MLLDVFFFYLVKTTNPVSPVFLSPTRTPQHEYVVDIGYRKVTAYTSTPEQTDNSPCIASSGDICERYRKGELVCATNEFPMGTILHLKGTAYKCVVSDRMNARYKNRIDLYLGYDEQCLDGVHKGDVCPRLTLARQFGNKTFFIHRIYK